MNNRENHGSIWRSIPGADRLLKIYGHYPTLHDAYLILIDIHFDARAILLTFEYKDLNSGSADKEIATKIEMRWTGVSEANFNLYCNSIYSIALERDDSLIKTVFENSSGTIWTLVAKDIEVLSVEDSTPECEQDKTEYLNTPRIKVAQ
jgi:hypothetical protein